MNKARKDCIRKRWMEESMSKKEGGRRLLLLSMWKIKKKKITNGG